MHTATEQRLTAMFVVGASIAAALAAFWVSWHIVPATPVQYAVGNLLLSACPALLVWTCRHRFSSGLVVAGVALAIFTLTTVFAVHCRYFLAAPPRSALALLAVFLGGFAWAGLTVLWLGLILRRSGTAVSRPRSFRFVSAVVVAVRVGVLIGLPFAAIWLMDWPVLFVVFALTVFLLVDLTTNTVVIWLLRAYSQEPDEAAAAAVKEVERRCGSPAPMACVWLSEEVPPVCEARLDVTGRHTLLCSLSVGRLLRPEALVALLAHEWAHVNQDHLRRQVFWDGLTGAAACGLLMIIATSLPPRRAPGQDLLFVAIVLAVFAARYLLSMTISRHHQREADAAAAAIVSPAAVHSALARLGGGMPALRPLALFATHDTLQRRVEAIQQTRR